MAFVFVIPDRRLPANVLSTIMFLMGTAGAVIHFLSRRERRRLLLATMPGTIAAVVSLTSRSGWGELLLPYDDRENLTEKLSTHKFGLDPRTGAIVVDDAGTSSAETSQDEIKLGLLEQGANSSRQLNNTPPLAPDPPSVRSESPQLYNPYGEKNTQVG